MEGVRQSVPDISREKLVLQEPEASGVFSHARFKKKKNAATYQSSSIEARNKRNQSTVENADNITEDENRL